MPFKNVKHPYIIVMSVILALITVLYSARVFYIQIIKAEEYNKSAAGIVYRTATLPAARGEILDSSGRKIAVNRDGYDVVFSSAYVDRNTFNQLILKLINLCEGYTCEYIDNLPMEKFAPYSFVQGSGPVKLRKMLSLADYATAEDCFDRLVERYELQAYSKEDARKIMGVRYSVEQSGFSISAPYTFAEDISNELMLVISESGYILNGVSVELTPYREYPLTTLASHIIGTIGPIYEEEWEKYKTKGYNYNDKVGKSGIEAYAEEYLHGTDGEITYRVDADGKIISSEITKAPVNGKTVMLTLDKTVQTVSQDILKSTIDSMQAKGSTVTGGAVVVRKIDSGAIIAAANYPTYDMATLSKDYNDLVQHPGKPLLDRAFQGVYPIGSTMKPIVAVAAMQNGHLQFGETIRCVGEYKYFSDYQPKCMHYHGTIGLKTALAKSCNYYFFELGRRTGISTLNQYFKKFGLGVKTGVEVNDSKGILTEFDYDSGNTIQVAIGQLNAFTPLQLASYTATLANGGKRYRSTLIDKIVSYDFKQTYVENNSEVVDSIEIDNDILSSVKDGMLSVTTDGTGSAAFATYPIKVGGKTGTSQTDGGADHSVFIAFAPFDNPKIAVSVVLEHGDSTFSVTSVAKAVLDSYFFPSGEKDGEKPPFVVVE